MKWNEMAKNLRLKHLEFKAKKGEKSAKIWRLCDTQPRLSSATSMAALCCCCCCCCCGWWRCCCCCCFTRWNVEEVADWCLACHLPLASSRHAQLPHFFQIDFYYNLIRFFPSRFLVAVWSPSRQWFASPSYQLDDYDKKKKKENPFHLNSRIWIFFFLNGRVN